jgi:hypothetical protein
MIERSSRVTVVAQAILALAGRPLIRKELSS